MQIYGPVQVHGAQTIGAPHSVRSAPQVEVSPNFSTSDEVQISEFGQLLDRIRQVPDIRADRVAAIRQAIAEGAYETDDKLDIALSRLADELG